VLFNAVYRTLNKKLHQFEEYGSRKIPTEFSEKKWKREGLDTLLKKIQETGSTDERHESERQTKTRAYWRELDQGVWTDRPTRRPNTNTSFNTPDIQRDGSNTVLRIIYRDVGLKCLYSFTEMRVSYYC